ncbi:MAG: PKD domain-containing protein [Anaerolineae bacterium]
MNIASKFTTPQTIEFDHVDVVWGDGTTSTCPPDSAECTIDWVYNDPGPDIGTVTGSHAYRDPGIYTLQVTVQDIFGQFDTSTYEFVVVYDPEGGFVTGGGWIDSPPGAYVPDPGLAGKATFAFVSKYKRGATVPTGNTHFQFKAGELGFHSESYDWLVVNRGGSWARFKGSGLVNGNLDPNGNEHRFMLWAGDGAISGDPDTFRIKIWEEDASGVEHIIYDNGFDQPIGGGSIHIQR